MDKNTTFKDFIENIRKLKITLLNEINTEEFLIAAVNKLSLAEYWVMTGLRIKDFIFVNITGSIINNLKNKNERLYWIITCIEDLINYNILNFPTWTQVYTNLKEAIFYIKMQIKFNNEKI